MSESNYKVSLPPQVADQFRVAVAGAETQGRRDTALLAKRLMEILEHAPYDLGESREEFPVAGIQIRVGFVSSFVIYFGLHEDSKNVFIRSIAWR